MKTEIKLIKDFIKKINFSNIKVKSTKSYNCAIIDCGIIFFNKEYYTDKYKHLANMTMNILKQQKLDFGKIHFGTFSILHEIGHIVSSYRYIDIVRTYNNYVDDENKLYAQFQKNCKKMNLEQAKERWQREYRLLKIERDADKKAYEIYCAYPELVNELNQQMKKLLGQTEN